MATPSKRKSNDFHAQLNETIIAAPLLDQIAKQEKLRKQKKKTSALPVVIDLSFNHHEGLDGAKLQACRLLAQVLDGVEEPAPEESLDSLLERLRPAVDKFKTELCPQYIFAELFAPQIKQLLTKDETYASGQATQHLQRMDDHVRAFVQERMRRPLAHDVQGRDEVAASASATMYRNRSIYKIWPDFDAEPQLTRTISTVKADAARASFSATGKQIVWAVIDSGIDGVHPHFQHHKNLDLPPRLKHADFTRTDGGDPYLTTPEDKFGHGTHVAGIIAGEMRPENGKSWDEMGVPAPIAVTKLRDKNGDLQYERWSIDSISGIAPECKLLSLRVLDQRGRGNRKASNILAALAYINKLNEYGRNIQVHGVNLSVGYEFEAEWFGCGQSPLCIEVDRLVRSGVVVVAAAGNTGYGSVAPSVRGPNMAGLSLTINDPGNANLAITVGSTHRYKPHQYGISYFSSKGPTGDGRLKPELVAPGENVLSCAAGRARDEVDRELGQEQCCGYLEESGTSMAAPHVSGAIAAFLSIQPGFIGQPEKVKGIFLSTATDLGRERYLQGHGLVDLMRAIQSV